MVKKKMVSVYISPKDLGGDIDKYYSHLEELLNKFYYCRTLKITANNISKAIELADGSDLFISLVEYTPESGNDEIVSKEHPDGCIFVNTENEKANNLANIIRTTSGNRFLVSHQKTLYTNSKDFVSIYIAYNKTLGLNTAAIASAIAILFGVKEKKSTEKYYVLKNGTAILAGTDKDTMITFCNQNSGTVVVNSKKEVIHKSSINFVNPMKNSKVTPVRDKASTKKHLEKLFGKRQ